MDSTEAIKEEEVFPSEELSYEEYLEKFRDRVLLNTSCCDVHQTLIRFVTRVIEPVGWKAIWRAQHTESKCIYEILIEVLDVSLTDLEAEVKCIRLCNKVSEDDDGHVQSIMAQNSVSAPLLHLYPTLIQDPNIYLEPTVQALDLLRFFYANLWRPWDDELNDHNDIFVDKYLESRLQLYFDAVSKTVPKATINKIASLITEGEIVLKNLNDLRHEMKAEDDMMELDEKDVLVCMELTMRLEAIQKEVDMLENPLLRKLMQKQELNYLSPKQKSRRTIDRSVTHLVGNVITFGMIKNLHLKDEDMIEQHDNVASAMNACQHGDVVLLFPGNYTCHGLGWIDSSITIQGVGSSNSDVVLNTSAEICGDIFINCSSKDITIRNVTIEVCEGSVSCLLTVHHGCVTVDNVAMRCVQPAVSNFAVTVLDNAQFTAIHSSMSSCRMAGVFLNNGSKGIFTNCIIEHHKYGVMLDCADKKDDKLSVLSLDGCTLGGISDYAVYAVIPPQSELNKQPDINSFNGMPNFDFKYSMCNISANLGAMQLFPMGDKIPEVHSKVEDPCGIPFDPENEIKIEI